MLNQRTLDMYYADIRSLVYRLEHLFMQYKIDYDKNSIEYIYNMCDGLGHHSYMDNENKLGQYIKECCRYWERLATRLDETDSRAVTKITRTLYLYSNTNSKIVAGQCNEKQYHIEFDDIFNGWRDKLRRAPILNNYLF